MLQQSTLQFITDLKQHNNREWFETNRKKYEAAKEDFATLIDGVITSFGKKDEDIAGQKAKDCVFRINRDVRFSKDKSPYKTNMGAFLCKGGRKSPLAGYYFHCEPGNSFVGGGVWFPDAALLKKVRQEIDYCFEEFSAIIKSKKFVSLYKDLSQTSEYKLSRPPKGYDIDNPAIEYLKLKSFVTLVPIDDASLTDKGIQKKIVTAFETLQPLVYFLNRVVEG